MSAKLFFINSKLLRRVLDVRKCEIYATNRSVYSSKWSEGVMRRDCKPFDDNYYAISGHKRMQCSQRLSRRRFHRKSNSDDQNEDNEDNERRRPALMAFKPILLPNLWFKWKNFITIHTIIRPFFDNEFTLEKFIVGAKQALVHISNRLADGNIDALRGVVTDEALTEIRHNFGRMSGNQIQELCVQSEDIIYSFPYRIGIIMNDKDDRRWVEITVVYYCLYKYQTLTQRKDMSFEDFSKNFGENITICNYRFIRDYTKGVDSDWTVNLLSHFKNRATIE